MRAPNPHRPGFTLVELLVVTAIIGLLVALLLPAVQSAREAGRRVSCQSHVRQVALALHGYHDVMAVFPPSTLVKPRHSWAAMMLPFMERNDVHDLYRFDLDWYDPANQPAVTVHLETLRCPSAPGGKRRLSTARTDILTAITDYAPVTYVAEVVDHSGLIPPVEDRRGVMERDGSVRIADVLDGTSNTLVFVEAAGRPQFWTSRGRGPMDNDPGGGNLAVIGGRVVGAGWATTSNTVPLHSFDRTGLRVPGPCAINCTNNNEAFAFHPGGVNVGLADGSVQFLTETTELKTYAAVVTRAGGEWVEPTW